MIPQTQPPQGAVTIASPQPIIGMIGEYKFATELAEFLTNKGFRIIHVKDGDPVEKVREMIFSTNVFFVCVPLGTGEDGTIEMTNLYEMFEDLDEILDQKEVEKAKKIFIIRSEVIPGVTQVLQKLYPKFNFVIAHEFLEYRKKCVLLSSKNPQALNTIVAIYQTIVNTPIRVALEGEVEFIIAAYHAFESLRKAFYEDMEKLSLAFGLNWQRLSQEVDTNFDSDFQRFVTMEESSEAIRHLKELYKEAKLRGYDSPLLKRLLE